MPTSFHRLLARACALAGFCVVLTALPVRADQGAVPVPTPHPVIGPRTDLPPIPHTNVVALPLIANMGVPPQVVEAAAAYAEQTQYTPGAGVARTITPYSVGTTLLPAGSPVVAEPGTLASPQVDVVVRQPVTPPEVTALAQRVTVLTAAEIAGSPSMMPGSRPTTLVVSVLPAQPAQAAIVPKVATATPTASQPVTAANTVPAAAPVSTGSCCGVVVIAKDNLVAQPLPAATPQPSTGVQVGAGYPAAPAPAGPGVQPTLAPVVIAAGGEGVVCNSFNSSGQWASVQAKTDILTDWYGGWAPFAVDDGIRQSRNLTFSLERVVGPGNNYGGGYSAKIASNQPYAGGFGSPLIQAPPGSIVTVRVKYLIWDYIQNPDDADQVRDWASMGVKPDAYDPSAVYVNGYTRGQWAQLTNSVVAGKSGQVMVLLQGESAGPVNSNIYFDDVQIFVGGVALTNCVLEQ